MEGAKIKQITAELLNTTPDNIVGVGYGYKEVNGKTSSEKCITFSVKEKKPLSEIPQSELLPSTIEIDGEVIKTDVVQLNLELFGFIDCSDSDPDFYSWQSTTPGNRGSIRPLQGGISITNYTSLSSYVGTLGFIAVDNDTNSLVGVSNNHVLINDAFYASDRDPNSSITNVYLPTGNLATQPNESVNSSPTNRIGIVKKYQPISPAPAVNLVDVACIALDSSVVDENISWKQYGLTNITSAPRFATTSEIDSALNNPNQVFYSSGRTTGAKGEGATKLYCSTPIYNSSLSYKLQGINTTCNINDCFELRAKGPTTPEGDWCTYPSNSGDSGSAILTEIGGEFVIVGLLFAGAKTLWGLGPSVTTVCCRIDNVATALNISAWNGSLTGISFSDNDNAETIIVDGQSSEKNIIRNGKVFWQVGMTTSPSTDL